MEPTLSKNMRYWFAERKNYKVPAVEVSALIAAHEALITGHPLHQGRLIHAETGKRFARKWNRIVVGGHGPYVEFTHYEDFMSQLVVPEDQVWRLEDKRYKDKVKYIHYALKDIPHVKIYHQRKIVSYADYVPGRFYVDAYQVLNVKSFQDS